MAAHQPTITQQRSSAQQPPPPFLDPNRKNHHHHPAARKPLDPTTISTFKSTTSHSSRFHHPNKKPINNDSPPVKDVHLQAKSLTLSAIHDSSKLSNSFLKPNPKTDPPIKSSYFSSSKELQKKKFYQFIASDKEEAQDKECKKKVGKEEKEEVDRLDISKLSVSLDLRGRRRRRSFGGCQVELGDVFANNGVKVLSADMPPFMQIHVVDFARKTHDSMEKFTCKALALTLKKEFDGVYGPAWHCMVGTNFGSFVTHSVGGFLYFSMDQKLYILLFKTAVQRAE